MRSFDLICLSLPALPDPAVPLAATRAGALGVLDLTMGPSPADVGRGVGVLSAQAAGPYGLRLDPHDTPTREAALARAARSPSWILLAGEGLPPEAHLVKALQDQGSRVAAEITSLAEARAAADAGVNLLLARGHEAGGRVGEETAFILLQRLLEAVSGPVWVQGGIGVHTAPACYAAGAAGVVLDAQLALARESALGDETRETISRMDGSETRLVGGGAHPRYRIYCKPGARAAEELASRSAAAAGSMLRSRAGWGSPGEDIWLLGQDAAFAADLARRHRSVGGIVQAIRREVDSHVAAARELRPLDSGAPLARSHGTLYPVVQGPMTRVSDTPRFAMEVASGGGLPFLALALLRAGQVRSLLEQTRDLLGERPWGVGILGFVPLELRQEQLEVIKKVRPAFALIAGGRPDQARVLELEGIPTYLHVPSPGLLRLFLENGSRRFVFEGRECGGHVGPRASFVLWNTMIDVLLEELPPGEAEECHVLFAGGVHDARSAAMVAAMAAPLARRGVKIGVLMGTAYLFTREAVSSGAILEGFQQEAVRCEGTVLLETGPGHATRCSETEFAGAFLKERKRLESEGRSPEEIRAVLEEMNLGRLRIASKGVRRRTGVEGKTGGPGYEKVEPQEQRRQGMYMIGQVAAARSEVTTISRLHSEVCVAGSELLASLSRPDMSADVSRREHQPCDIAIIGMGCMLPKAPDLATYWSNILNKVDAIGEVPQDRWDWRLYYDPDPSAPDKIYSRWGGFLDDHPFDPMRYGMPPATLPSIEPLQLLTLDVVRAALEDSGYLDEPRVRPRTSVVLGAGGGVADLGSRYGIRAGLPNLVEDVPREVMDALPQWTEDSFAGILLNVAAGRVANRFDLGGANFTVDAACASSLAAVYLGIKELESGTSDMVIAGGTDTVQNPFGYLCFSKTKALSPRGRCRTFDASADGIVISEGLAAVVLKRLADAERDGDRIYAVIKGIAASSDGRDKGLTAPRREGQIAALERAYGKAGLSPSTVGLVEAHGTGTVAGDRAEVEALKSVFDQASDDRQWCAIGSVKSMIGHTKCTAGVAGLIKVALALHHKVLPPTLHVTEPNPRAGFPESPFYVSSETRPWVRAASAPARRAGVSAFGFGGTNFHAVVEEHDWGLPAARGEAVQTAGLPELLLVRGGSRAEIDERLATLEAALRGGARPRPADLAFSLWRRARELDEAASRGAAATMALVVERGIDPAERITRARRLLAGQEADIEDPTGIYFSSRGLADGGEIAFLFPGQGSQYPGMLDGLTVLFPEARSAFEEFDEALAGALPRPLSRYIFPPPAFTAEDKERQSARLTETNVAQPALGAAGTAMLRVLGSLGLRPAMAAGHSYGEYVALHAAGVIDAGVLALLSEARGRSIIEAAREDLGTMAAVPAGRVQVQEILRDRDDVWIANLNAPEQTVISGTEDGIASVVEEMKRRGIEARPLPVACAFHSPLVAPARDRLSRVLGSQEFRPPSVKVFSNTTATAYPEDGRATATLLTEHLVNPVLFADEIEAMYAEGARVFVEVGPRGVLASLTGQILSGRPHLAVATDQPGRPGMLQLLHAVGRLAAHGATPDLERLFRGRPVRALRLEALVEETREEPLPATTWMVNGGRARPLREVADAEGRPTRPAAPRPVSLEKMAPAPRSAPPSPARPESPSGAVPGDDLLSRHQGLMDRFLEVHRSVMMAALQEQDRPASGDHAAAAAAPAPRAEAGAPPAPPRVAAGEGPGAPASGTGGERERDGGSLPGSPGPGREEIVKRLLDLVSERTGYPPEMLGLDVDMEADLGIDSIKRVEILGVMQKACFAGGGTAPPGEVEKLNACRTLGAVIDWFQEAIWGGDAAEPAPPAIREAPPGSAPSDAPTGAAAPAGELPRFVLVAEPEELDPASLDDLDSRGVHLITGGDPDLAGALAERLGELGGRAVVLTGSTGSADFTAEEAAAAVGAVRDQHGPVCGWIHLATPGSCGDLRQGGLESWRSRLQADVKSFFHLARAAAADLREAASRGGAVVAGVTALGGRFGLEGGDAHPASGGLAGLVKTLDQEWESVRCVTVDTDPGEPAGPRARAVVEEIQSTHREPEVGRSGAGRYVFRARREPLSPRASLAEPAGPGDVILVTGGARGITAESALRLAAREGITLILAGRSPLPPGEEPPETRSLQDAREIKAALMASMEVQGRPARLAGVERAYRRLMKDREIRSNISRLRKAGAVVEYRQVDVRDESAFSGLLDEILARHGRLDGVIHGAGIIEDKLLLDKSPDSFDRVFDTKADSAYILATRLNLDSMKFLAFFASVSGPFGSRGQCDYAAANEVVNRLAARLASSSRARVVSINWGPWATTGMAGEEVQRQFRERGVQIIEPGEGSGMLGQELRRGAHGHSAVVIGGGPWPAAAETGAATSADTGGLPLLHGVQVESGRGDSVELTRTFDPARDLYLADHRLDGNPVVPAAVAMELMAEAAQRGWPDLSVAGLRDLRVLKGVIVDNGPRPVKLSARAAVEPPHDRPGVDVTVEITDPDQPGLRYYRSTVEMSDGLPEPPSYDLPFRSELKPFTLSLEEAYRKYLFHGRLFEGIRKIHGVCRRGMTATLAASSPAECLAGGEGQTVAGRWLIDPVVFDSGLQMVILWARLHLDVTPLPSRYTRYVRYGSLSGEEIRCDLHIKSETSESLFFIDLVFSDPGGRLLGILEGMECPSSRSFNRLAGGHLRTA